MANKKNEKKSVNLLPTFFRTDKNAKFLSSTLDQLIKSPVLERIDGFVGSKLTQNYNPSTDKYITEITDVRRQYQLEPALIVSDIAQGIKKAFGYDDLINQISYYGGKTDNLDRLFRPKVNSFDPHIDWDKFINFREYYWMPTGPGAITISGVQESAVSTFTVSDSADGKYFVFTPDGLTSNPLVELYRGMTYVFDVSSAMTFYIADADGNEYNTNVAGNATKQGQVILTITDSTPASLFYKAKESQDAFGQIAVKRITENSALDVEKEIIGKSQYRSGDGIQFENGLTVKFEGRVIPESYVGKEFIVEGVGNAIQLISMDDLITPADLATLQSTDYAGVSADQFPFDTYKSIPIVPEYVTVNRASKDLNPWSRYNRWFHISVLTAIANANGTVLELPYSQRAARPIIEFRANIQLWNFGSVAIKPVDLIDTKTTDAFSVAEKASNYYVDGVLLQEGQRVIFNADLDPFVRGKVFTVNRAVIDGKEKLDLVEAETLVDGNSFAVTSGTEFRGTEWKFTNGVCSLAQQREAYNQAPLFDLFDRHGNSYSGSYYDSEFAGSRMFGYGVSSAGTVDPVLGFPLKYRNDSNLGVGSYVFENYFNTESIALLVGSDVQYVPTSETYLRLNNISGDVLENVWTKEEYYQIPVLQTIEVSDATDIVQITCFKAPALITDLTVAVFVNGVKLQHTVDYTLVNEGPLLFVKFAEAFSGTSTTQVLIKCWTSTAPNSNGTYETPLNLTNNPLNGPIAELTLSELSDHVKTMVERESAFSGEFPGASNLKDLPNITKYGTRLISNQNPLSFAHYFITDVENNVIDAIRQAATDYYGFKLTLVNFLSKVDTADKTPAQVLDAALAEMNANKNSNFRYAHSDMLGYGDNAVVRTYKVTDVRNTNYALSDIFSLITMGSKSVLVYHTDSTTGETTQLLYLKDYTFETTDASVRILKSIARGDVITVTEYQSTVGSYVPPTPTKLGLYSKFEPAIFIDTSYVSGPTKVIQGHDGSITVAFSKFNEADDFRDLAILEFEKRVYNNLKVEHDVNQLTMHDVIPSVFRKTDYSLAEVNDIIRSDFIKWASLFGVDTTSNSSFDLDNHKTYNYRSAVDYMFNSSLPGNWRGIYNFYFDTDRPNTHPWEMLGFTVQPLWWESVYGPAPYTAGNKILWDDLEAGRIRQGARAGIDLAYARPGLSNIIPVDDSGNTVDVRDWAGIAENEAIANIDQEWKFGDFGPAEAAWRRSSLWPFAVQVLLALTKPADYAALMFDPARLEEDVTGQYNYGPDEVFMNPASVLLFADKDSNGEFVNASGYSVWVIEKGLSRVSTYVETLKSDLQSADFKLFYKAAGFMSKDKLDILIDSINPSSVNPGVSLPSEDYELHFNVSNPVKTVSVSGIIVEKKNGQFVVKGYDKYHPYFTVNAPIYQSTYATVTVGGKSEAFVSWMPNVFYQAGQVVYYASKYYRVTIGHNSGTSFATSNYQLIREVPMVGGVTVKTTTQFDTDETVIPYGTGFDTIQEVYDLIIGYGNWLTKQGFVFDDYIAELGQSIDWKFTGKEFLYWTTQNWAEGTVIALSPFADSIQFKFTDAAVDNVLDSFYEYSLLKADGQPFPVKHFSMSREDSVCTIQTKNTAEGLYFAKLNLVQKEHAIVLNNKSMFNDIINDIETGYRQRRVKLIGFKTADWNGQFMSPGFVYDDAQIEDWAPYTDYRVADIVKYAGKYYSATRNVEGTEKFDFTVWNLLGTKPVAQLLPNFDYKIKQFDDFYSLDIDNFDMGQQKMAQHLTGYTPRVYLDNIFVDQIAQYKFYQGFIKEKGTKNAIDKLAKASVHNLHGQIEFNEEWAFRVGAYGNFTSYNEIEFPLVADAFKENSQIIKMVDTTPSMPNDVVAYVTPSNLALVPTNYNSSTAFAVEESTFANNNQILPSAGYARLDEVTATAYNDNSLLDIANNGAINEGDTIWVGFKDNGDWGVYRYTKQLFAVLDSEVSIPGAELTFATDKYHRLAAGDVVSIYGLDNGTDGVYKVLSIPSLTSFTVATTVLSVSVSQTTALLYKFVSVRVTEFDNIVELQSQVTFNTGDLVWTDNNTDGKWAVYQKTVNFGNSVKAEPVSTVAHQQHGAAIATADGAQYVVVGSPQYQSDMEIGRVFVYGVEGDNLYPIVNYGINSVENEYFTGTTSGTGFGSVIAYNEATARIYAGAPTASYVLAGGDTSNEGLVKVSTFDSGLFEENTIAVLTTPATFNATNALFGSSIFVGQTSSGYGRMLVIGAPGMDGQIGKSFVYNADTLLYSGEILPNSYSTSMMFGSAITGNADASVIAISAPGFNNATGKIFVYRLSESGYAELTSINAPAVCKMGDKFGSVIKMSEDGQYLVASSTNVTESNVTGKVFVYKWNSNVAAYVLNQTIDNVSNAASLVFGVAIDLNKEANTLVITASGTKSFGGITFDNETTFDGTNCIFGDPVSNAGTAYVFNRYNDKFVLAEELFDNAVLANSKFGASIAINHGLIMIGAPDDGSVGSVYLFSKIDSTNASWKLVRTQPDLVDISKINRAVLIDVGTEQIVNYLDVFDPVKGKIPGISDQEIRFKTAFDPAVYSIGVQGVVVDTDTSWIDAHVGELWWDLSSVKYVWYEQGDLEYRKNTWGTLFPGASIDVYEWVKSEYLPSQWSAIADTVEGLAQGISGQPKYPDNSVISVQQYYNANTATTTNIYYYWVKNKVTIPSVASRKMAAAEVARILFNPAGYGMQYVSVIAPNAITVTNVKNSLVADNMHLNIAMDDLNSEINRHTEWVLLEENGESAPNTILEKKLFDSLLGKDSLGNVVPDPQLSARARYGISIRPRQSMFKDRIGALRNAIDYTNSVLAENAVSNSISFATLNSKEEIPDAELSQYDEIVDFYEDLSTLVTARLTTAELSCEVVNGRIVSVEIVDPGYGYKIAPEIEVLNDTSGAKLKATINEAGQITAVEIINAGRRFVTAPMLHVRPFTVIVAADASTNNKWAMYYRVDSGWNKVRTQKFDTTQYWDYRDWSAADYDSAKPLTVTIDQLYMLDTISPNTGDYVKVRNQGNGRYVILRKVTSAGTFTNLYDLMYEEKGTIKFKDTIWNTRNSIYNFDYVATFDQTFYDQSPEVEIKQILTAIRDDIFVGTLKSYWNKFFFKAVKYALSEQLFVDWAFKTSFITVTNKAGELAQRPVYKFQDSQFYEQYLEEVKPYKTKIRNFKVSYDVTEPSNTFNTDFDLPADYDENTGTFSSVDFGNTLLDVYPRKAWKDNYTFSVGSVDIISGGSGYTVAPLVTIVAAPGDTGTGATALALIENGEVSAITMVTAGTGYTQTPSVEFTGGGNSKLVAARAIPRLVNGKVRSTKIGLRFDRVSATNEMIDKRASDTFVCSSTQTVFPLTWAAEFNKSEISITLNGIVVLATDYNINTYTSKYATSEDDTGYTKLHSEIVLNTAAAIGDVLVVEYNKHIDLYHAADRVEHFYNPSAGMPGKDLSQVMSGVSFPGTQIQTIPFTSSMGWDLQPLGSTEWDTTKVALDTVIDGGDINYTLASGVNPSDIIVDGDLFLSPVSSYAPEEVIPGQVNESVGISVYTVSEDKSVILGFRMFKDLLNRTTYKRLSAAHSTTLAAPLHITDTQIVVENAAVLAMPNVEKNIPGVILVDAERIEYMEVTGNTLSRLRRATLGTGAKDTHEAGTTVVDQSLQQNLPYKDAINVCTTSTLAGETSFDIANMSVVTGSRISFVSTTDRADEVEVIYGGIKLTKSDMLVHDKTIAYDTGEYNSSGVSSDVNVPAQMSVSTTTSASIVLNSNVITPIATTLTVVQRTAVDWRDDTTLSLLDDEGLVALFLKESPAALPDKYVLQS